ncbi:hypothetical protein BJX63DRAFT_289663 [Aspergillus granulosus]|uniref:Uncharacterized protein n=1 Tax=Aspergillus granulosus TaxID=176169 RepID=A0ABR4H6Y9_9EURO
MAGFVLTLPCLCLCRWYPQISRLGKLRFPGVEQIQGLLVSTSYRAGMYSAALWAMGSMSLPTLTVAHAPHAPKTSPIFDARRRQECRAYKFGRIRHSRHLFSLLDIGSE